jgi:hypothetical protein
MTVCIGKPNLSVVSSEASAQRVIEDRILARHRRIADRLTHNPGLIDHAKSNLHRWASTRGDDVPPTWLVEGDGRRGSGQQGNVARTSGSDRDGG